MSIRGFIRAFLRDGGASSRVRHPGDELADEIRETIGTQAGGGRGGRMTGSAVYRFLENRKRR